MFKEYNFSPGIVTFYDYDIFSDEEIDEDNDDLVEDMLQVEFDNDIALDVGWYSGIKCFIVFVIKQCDWEKPLLRLEARTYLELKSSLDRAMSFIKDILV